MMSRPLALAAALAFLLIASSSCTTTQLGEAVELGALLADEEPERARQYRQATESLAGAVSPIDFETERALGGSVAVKATRQVGPLVEDEGLQRYVNLVGLSLARNSERPTIPYAFGVLENPAPNAFAGPGGYIFITTGALDLMDSEAELAGVLAHEIAHVTRGHMLQTFRRSSAFRGALDGYQALRDGSERAQRYSALADFATNTLFDRGFDQRLEFEADEVGAEIAMATGYDPRGLITFLGKMEASTGHRNAGWFRTHPPTPERVRRLRTLVDIHMGDPGGVIEAERFARHTGRGI